jgi:3'(2'), 5'-bisphosphate nucleotidase
MEMMATTGSRTDGLSEEHRSAGEFAAEAGVVLMELRARTEPGKALGREGDRLSHRLLMARLGHRFPEDRIRSEEATQSEVLESAAGRVWIIDPLDGTREYSEGREDWAVHVALAIDGNARVGAVALPAMSLVLGTEDPPKVAAPREMPRLVVSRSRPPEFVPALAERLGATTVAMGSAGAKIASVIRGESEIYVHAGGQYEWDSAAPVAVALAGGLHASRLDGSPLRYSQPDPWMPDLVVCHPDLTAAVMEAVGAVVPTEAV